MPSREGYWSNREYYQRKNREHYWTHPEARINSLQRSRDARCKARLVVGRGVVKCTNCGCDDERIIEINHINGGGNQEFKRTNNPLGFYRDVINGKRSIEDLNLLCKICNHLHYIDRKFGVLPFKVLWKS